MNGWYKRVVLVAICTVGPEIFVACHDAGKSRFEKDSIVVSYRMVQALTYPLEGELSITVPPSSSSAIELAVSRSAKNVITVRFQSCEDTVVEVDEGVSNLSGTPLLSFRNQYLVGDVNETSCIGFTHPRSSRLLFVDTIVYDSVEYSLYSYQLSDAGSYTSPVVAYLSQVGPVAFMSSEIFFIADPTTINHRYSELIKKCISTIEGHIEQFEIYPPLPN